MGDATLMEGRCYAAYDYEPSYEDELRLHINDAVKILDRARENEPMYWWAKHEDTGKTGEFFVC